MKLGHIPRNRIPSECISGSILLCNETGEQVRYIGQSDSKGIVVDREYAGTEAGRWGPDLTWTIIAQPFVASPEEAEDPDDETISIGELRRVFEAADRWAELVSRPVAGQAAMDPAVPGYVRWKFILNHFRAALERAGYEVKHDKQ